MHKDMKRRQEKQISKLDGEGHYALCGSPESLTRDEKFRELFFMEFYQKILYLHVSHTVRLSPSKSSISTTVSNIFANSPTIFCFLFLSKKQTHTICNSCPHIVDPLYSGQLSCILVWCDSKKRCVRSN